ncbi:hypothetical protein Tco_0566490 [Tanacetum coccineum]
MSADSALLEQAPHSPEYVPDLIELEDHVPVYIPEPEHPEDLVSAEDEAPIETYITEVRDTERMDDEIRVESEDEIYGRLDDAQDDRSLMSGQLNLLRRDRHAHARITRLMESEARLSHEAWVQSMDASSRPQETDITHKGIDSAKDTADSNGSITESADTY